LIHVEKQLTKLTLDPFQTFPYVTHPQPNVMSLQNLRLRCGVVQNPPQHSFPNTKLFTHGRDQLSQVMQHEPERSQLEIGNVK
jgi:hypothetical protein